MSNELIGWWFQDIRCLSISPFCLCWSVRGFQDIWIHIAILSLLKGTRVSRYQVFIHIAILSLLKCTRISRYLNPYRHFVSVEGYEGFKISGVYPYRHFVSVEVYEDFKISESISPFCLCWRVWGFQDIRCLSISPFCLCWRVRGFQDIWIHIAILSLLKGTRVSRYLNPYRHFVSVEGYEGFKISGVYPYRHFVSVEGYEGFKISGVYPYRHFVSVEGYEGFKIYQEFIHIAILSLLKGMRVSRYLNLYRHFVCVKGYEGFKISKSISQFCLCWRVRGFQDIWIQVWQDEESFWPAGAETERRGMVWLKSECTFLSISSKKCWESVRFAIAPNSFKPPIKVIDRTKAVTQPFLKNSLKDARSVFVYPYNQLRILN